MSTMTIAPSPACQISTHTQCAGTATDETGQERVTCPCPCHDGTDPADIDPADLHDWTISTLVRQWVIADNELRDIAWLRVRGEATAEQLTQARHRVAATRQAADSAMESLTPGRQVQGDLFGIEVAR